MKNNNSKIVIIMIVLIIILVIIGFINYNNYTSNKQINNNKVIKEKDNKNTIKENEQIDNNDNIKDDTIEQEEIDLDKWKEEISSSVKNNKLITILSKCESETIEEGSLPKTTYNITEVSNDTINTIIEKLKTAKSIDKNITFSWNSCPPKSITYYISTNSTNIEEIRNNNTFSLNYANSDDILLVGYNQKGYAFHFNSDEIINFIESLK